MRRIFIGLTLLAAGILTGCDKNINEATRPAPLHHANA